MFIIKKSVTGLILCMMLFSAALHAQTKHGGGTSILWGVEGSLLQATYRLSPQQSIVSNSESSPGFSAGVKFKLIPFDMNGFFFWSGLFYKQVGGLISDEEDFPRYTVISPGGEELNFWENREEKLSHFSVPLMVSFMSKSETGLVLSAGFELNFCQGGSYQISLSDALGRFRDGVTGEPYNVTFQSFEPAFKENGDIDAGDDSPSDLYQVPSLDFKVAIGIVRNLNSGGMLDLSLNFNYGLTNLYNQYSPTESIFQNALGISAGFSLPFTD